MPDTTATSVTPLQGKTSIDDKMFFDPERLSYESAVQIAARIAARVKDSVGEKAVVIASSRLLADFANLRAIYLLLANLQRDYESIGSQARALTERRSRKRTATVEQIVEEGFAEGVAAATGIASGIAAPAATLVGTALGLVSLFRQDVEYHGEKTLIDGLGFEIALAATLHKHGVTNVFVPDLVIMPPPGEGKSRLEESLNHVQTAKNDAWTSAGPLISNLVRIESELDEAAKAKNQGALDRLSVEVSNLRRDMAPIIDPLSRLDQRLSDVQNQMNQTEPTTGLMQLARLLRAETLQILDPAYLHATVVSSGGYYRISRNLFRTLFMGDGLSFAGGAIARWALLRKDGSIESGGIDVVSLKGRFGMRRS
jgi:hypothetical protein